MSDPWYSRQEGSGAQEPWSGGAGSPIADGTQALRHDGQDVAHFRAMVAASPRLAELLAASEARLPTASALIADLFWSFLQLAPEVDPVVPLAPAYQANATVLAEVMGSLQWTQVRAAGTVGDPVLSAVATTALAEQVLVALEGAPLDEGPAQFSQGSTGGGTSLATDEQGDDSEDDQTDGKGPTTDEQSDEAKADQEQTPSAGQAGEDMWPVDEGLVPALIQAAQAGLDGLEKQIAAANAGMDQPGQNLSRLIGAAAHHRSAAEQLALAEQLARSPRLAEVAAMCGRILPIALRVQERRADQVPEEISAISLGRDLSHLLPSELALLGDPELEDLFGLKLAEARLMQYALVGQERLGRGPIIVAVDSSRSMDEKLSGVVKAVWAKAVAFSLLGIARAQGRDAAIIHFSGPGQLASFHFPKGRATPAELAACASVVFRGGTTFGPWMTEALRLVDEAAYARADVICLSDGAVRISDKAQEEWQRRRLARGMRVYSVLIGDMSSRDLLASMSDEVLLVQDFQQDRRVLPTIFKL